MDRVAHLSLKDEKVLTNLGHCFTSSLRRKIIAEINDHSCSIMELAEKFNVPLSTMSTNIKILQDAGIVLLSKNPKKRGNEKIVSLASVMLHINLTMQPVNQFNQKVIDIPLGSYMAFNVKKPCGMADEHGIIFENDEPESFLSPSRIKAELLWFKSGYVEYAIPLYLYKEKWIRSISFSLELCSECPNYRNDWKSEVTFWINETEIATYVSPGDFGGRQGRITPSSWSTNATQYGILKNVCLNEDGTFIDGILVSNVTIDDIEMRNTDRIRLRIGVKDDAKFCGGINIFGKRFGDYPQNISMVIEYQE